MVESLLLGLRDLMKNKRIFIVFVLAILLICMTGISATTSLVREMTTNFSAGEASGGYTAVPISNDMSSNSQMVNEVNQLLEQGGMSFFYSEQLSSQTNFPTIVVIDAEQSKSFQGEQYEGEALVGKLYATSDIQQKMNLDDMQFPEPVTFASTSNRDFAERAFDNFLEDEVVILLLQADRLDKWIDTEFGLEVVELVENVRFNESDKKKGLNNEFEAILEGSFLQLKTPNHQSDELKFILLYVFPAIALIIISLLVALAIMYGSIFTKLYRMYTIHLISGATLTHIYIRNSVFSITLVSVCFLIISFLNKFRINDILIITAVILSVVLVIFEVLLYLVLKRKNVSMTLKGD